MSTSEIFPVQFKLSDSDLAFMYENCEEILDAPPSRKVAVFCNIVGKFPTNLELTGFIQILNQMRDEKYELDIEYPQNNSKGRL